MFGQMDIMGVMNMLGKNGINVKSLFGLMSGKATPEEKKKTLVPILQKVEPAHTSALEHLEQKYGKKVFITLSTAKNKNDLNQKLTVVAICTKDDEGKMVQHEKMHFPDIAAYIIDELDRKKQAEAKAGALQEATDVTSQSQDTDQATDQDGGQDSGQDGGQDEDKPNTNTED